MHEDSNLQLVEIRVEKKVASYIYEQKYYYGFVSEIIDDEHITMTFLSGSLEAFARWFLMIAPNATILQPASLKLKLQRIISEIAANIS